MFVGGQIGAFKKNMLVMRFDFRGYEVGNFLGCTVDVERRSVLRNHLPKMHIRRQADHVCLMLTKMVSIQTARIKRDGKYIFRRIAFAQRGQCGERRADERTVR